MIVTVTANTEQRRVTRQPHRSSMQHACFLINVTFKTKGTLLRKCPVTTQMRAPPLQVRFSAPKLKTVCRGEMHLRSVALCACVFLELHGETTDFLVGAFIVAGFCCTSVFIGLVFI